MKNILLGISGSIAAPKSLDLLKALIQAGFQVKVVLTHHARQFLDVASFKAVPCDFIYTDLVLGSLAHTLHIDLARWADIILIAPATANRITKLALGLSDDLLSLVCLASRAKVLVVPAMNSVMWEHWAMRAYIRKLKGHGVEFLGPDVGKLACGEKGQGRMLAPRQIVQNLIKRQLPRILDGLRILITAGATREMIDPVRFISNRSSGKMGYALASEAILLGAQVTLVNAFSLLPIPKGCHCVITVKTAQDMQSALEQEASHHDILISAAAISDFRAKVIATGKIKRGDSLTLALVSNGDILANIAKNYPIFCVGFAAETSNVIEQAQQKRLKKGIALMVANDVSQQEIGFDSDENAVYLISEKSTLYFKKAPKAAIAQKLLRHIQVAYQAHELTKA